MSTSDAPAVNDDDPADLAESVIAEAYTRRPGDPALPYGAETARHALAVIAKRMSRDGTRDLHWWRIPEWVPPGTRVVASGIAGALAGGIVAGVACGIALAVTTGIENGLSAGIAEFLPGGVLYGILFGITGAVVGLGSGWAAVRPAVQPGSSPADAALPPVIGKVRLARALTRKSLKTGLRGGSAAALVGGIVGGVLTGLVALAAFGPEGGLVAGTAAAIGFGMWSALAIAVLIGIREAVAAGPQSTPPLHPAASWRGNGRYGRLVGCWFGILFGMSAGVLFGIVGGAHGLVLDGAGFGIAAGLTAGIMAGLFSSRRLPLVIASAWLAMRWGTPLRLLRFLGDANDRGILYAVGPSYQFRDAYLQDYLASGPPPGAGPDAR